MPTVPTRIRGVYPYLFGIALVLVVIGGAAFAHFRPKSPLLVWWVVAAILLGTWTALGRGTSGFSQRAEQLVRLYLILLPAGLLTTQYAAGRINSSTHLKYEGVVIENSDSMMVGTAETGADIVLPAPTRGGQRWTISFVRSISGWHIRSSGMDEIRVYQSTPPSLLLRFLAITKLGHPSVYDIPNAAVIENRSDSVHISGIDNSAVKLVLQKPGQNFVLSSGNNSFFAQPKEARLASRFNRNLASGVSLASLDGPRGTAAPYEQFVRVKILGWMEFPNAQPSTPDILKAFVRRAFKRPRILVTGTGPALISGRSSVDHIRPFRDSARVDVKSGGELWRFSAASTARTEFDSGLAIKFTRNPTPADIPLPTGISCEEGAACGILSTRRLAPPIANVWLGNAGFDQSRFGLLAKLETAGSGIDVILPRARTRITANNPDPSYLKVSELADSVQASNTSARAEPIAGIAVRNEATTKPIARSLLVRATSVVSSGFTRIMLIALGLFLLLGVAHTIIAGLTLSQSSLPSAFEKPLGFGLNSVLALLLTRLIIGARVSFFAPFEPRGIDTAVGMWISVVLVIVALVQWEKWLPSFLIGSRTFFSSHDWASGAKKTFRRTQRRFAAQFKEFSKANRKTAMFRVVAFPMGLLSLGIAVPGALYKGTTAAVCVILAWVSVAWSVAYSGTHFYSFESGPLGIVEDLPRFATAQKGEPLDIWSRLRRSVVWSAPVWFILPALFVSIALMGSAIALFVAFLIVFLSSVIYTKRNAAPTKWASRVRLTSVIAGSAFVAMTFSLLRAASDNGAMSALAAVILVTLSSVRAGFLIRSKFGIPRKRTRAAAQRTAQPQSSLLKDVLIVLALLGPSLLLIPLIAYDMGLFLVVVLPIGSAALLASGYKLLSIPARAIAALIFLFGVYIFSTKVLYPYSPSVEDLRTSRTSVESANMFAKMGEIWGFSIGGLERASARAVAASDQRVAEALLVSAHPGRARDLLIPSIEQAWGAKAYSAASRFGSGTGQAPVGSGGIAEAVSYAENSYAVYVLAEHGYVGGIVVLLLYAMVLLSMLFILFAISAEPTAATRASRALFLVASLLTVVPAIYVALSNLGLVPITGQNMPFLGLNAWSDVTLCSGLVAIFVTGAIRESKEIRGHA